MLLDLPTLQFLALANLGMVSRVLLVAAPLGCVPAGGQGCGALLAAWCVEAKARLHTRAMTDGLTGLLNRRDWLERADAALYKAKKSGCGQLVQSDGGAG